MCYRVQVNTGVGKIARRFKASIKGTIDLPAAEINGFSYQPVPVITNAAPEIIETDFFGV